jgi:hypothetical protein
MVAAGSVPLAQPRIDGADIYCWKAALRKPGVSLS